MTFLDELNEMVDKRDKLLSNKIECPVCKSEQISLTNVERQGFKCRKCSTKFNTSFNLTEQ